MRKRGGRSFEKDAAVVAGVAALLEKPRPFLGREEALAGELPVEEVHLLLLVSVCFDADIFRAPSDPLGWGLVQADPTALNATLVEIRGRYSAAAQGPEMRLLDVVLESLGRGYAPYIMRFQGYGATQYLLLAPDPSTRPSTP